MRISSAMVTGGRTLADPRISPDGRLVAVVAGGQLTVVGVDGGPEQVVASDPPVRRLGNARGGAFDWAPDSSTLVYVSAAGGLWAVPVTGGPSRRVVGVADGPHEAPAVSPDGRWVAYLVDQRQVAVASLDPDGPWPVRLGGDAGFAFDPVFAPDSSTVFWHHWDEPHMPWVESSIVSASLTSPGDVVEVAGGRRVAHGQPRVSADGRLAFTSDASGHVRVHPLSDGDEDQSEPAWGVGQRSFAWSPDGTRVAVCVNEHGHGRLDVVSLADGTTTVLGRGWHHSLSWAGDHLVALRSGARTPFQVVAYDVAGGTRRVLAHGAVAGFGDVPEPRLVSWPADDGTTIPGRLFLPEGVVAPPCVVWLHGGPTDQMTVSWNARLAWVVSRGWAVLVPDHRGTTGHGRAFALALEGRWGDLDVSDTAAGMRWAAESGLVDARLLVLMGGSAGGFTVLNLLVHHPHLCAGGIALYPVSDVLTLAEGTHRFEAHYDAWLVGRLPAQADKLRQVSPLSHADRLSKPLLLLHGSDDPVVPASQSRALAEAMRRNGAPVEHHEYPGEGHGWRDPATTTDELARIERFLGRVAARRL